MHLRFQRLKGTLLNIRAPMLDIRARLSGKKEGMYSKFERMHDLYGE